MKKPIYIFSLVFGLILNSFLAIGQTFTHEYKEFFHTSISSVLQTADGGFAAIGTANSLHNDTSGVFFVKTDANGNTLIHNLFPNTGTASVIRQAANGYIAAGRMSDSTKKLYFMLMKIDKAGNKVWEKKYLGSSFEYLSAIITTSDGGYLFTGADFSESIIVKTDSLGDTLWTKKFPDWFQISSIRQTSDFGYIMTGGLTSGTNCLEKITGTGAVNWKKSYKAVNPINTFDVDLVSDGGFIVAGESILNPTNGDGDAFLMKTNSNGDSLWTNILKRHNNREFYAVRTLANGDFIAAGQEFFENNIMDSFSLFVAKFTSDGKTLGSKTYSIGNKFYNNFRDIQETSDGGLIMAEDYENSGGDTANGVLIKVDTNGNMGISDQNGTTEHSLIVYPNPFYKSTTISNLNYIPGNRYRFTLYNYEGQLVKEINDIDAPNFNFDRGSERSGIYLYRIIDSKGMIANGKMIIE